MSSSKIAPLHGEEDESDDDGSVLFADPLEDVKGLSRKTTTKDAPSSLDRLLEGYTKFMGSPLRQDRSLKLMQYTLWAAGQLYGNQSTGRVALEKLSLDLSWVRMANRLLQWPMAADAAWNDSWTSSSTQYPRTFKLLGKMLALTMVGYYPAEHAAYLHWMVPKWLAKGKSAERFSFWSCRFWTAYIATEVVQCLLQLKELSSSDNPDDNKDEKDAKKRSIRLQLVRNAFFLAPAIHWSRSDWDTKPMLTSRKLNGLMFMEAVVCMYQTLTDFWVKPN